MSEKKSLIRIIIALAFCLVLAPVMAFAASTDAPAQNPAAPGLFLGFAIAYLSRRRAIGGWLLYFYMQLYLSSLLSLIFIPQIVTNLSPGGWDTSLRYVMFVVSTVPVVLAQLAEVVIATILLSKRNEGNVRLLRKILLAMVIASAAALLIDYNYFPEEPSIFMDGLSLFFSVIWMAYFTKSDRVRRVFIENNWDYASLQSGRYKWPEERRYLWKRAAVVFAITFVALFVLFGMEIGNKPPDAALFFVPVFYALVFAAISWFLPISKKRRETLLVSSTPEESE